MRTFRSLLAAVLMVVMTVCLSVSAFAAYEEIVYEDVSEMYGTTLDGVNTVYIKFVDKLGIVPSYNDGTFNPIAHVSRADALRIAYRMLHYDYDELEAYGTTNTDFDESGEEGDISDVHTLKPYIAWAQDYQLISAEYVPEKKFEPAADITGEEFITLIAKVLSIADGTSTAADYETALEVVLMDSQLDASKEYLNREQAALIVARAMMYDAEYGDVSEEMFTYFTDYDINCLATKVYGCYNTELIIRATKQRPMDYEEVTSDVLFSNGVQVDMDADMSTYIGWPLEVVFLDKDGSGTFTQDEEMITYTFVNPWVNSISLSDLTVSSFTALTGTSTAGETFKIQSNSLLYLNDQLWPLDDIYDLTSLVDYIEFAPNTTTKPASIIKNRPNLTFTFLRYSTSENAEVVFANEWIPGKVMTVTDNYISVYSYYDNETYVFDDNKVNMTKLANPSSGDYVNFYIAGDRMHLTAGNTMEFASCASTLVNNAPAIAGISEGGSSTNFSRHLFYNTGSKSPEQITGPVVLVLDSTNGFYLTVEEKKATKDAAIKIDDVVLNATNPTTAVDVKATVLATGEALEMTVAIDNIATITGTINKDDYYTFYETADGDIMMEAIDPLTMNVIETEDYFITKGGKKYLKTETFVSDSDTFYNGTATLLIDRYDGVWGVKAA
ncbi:MAG: S-layer homology domain-containing protein [Clostridia bacterium]|nr:S-layer homology domain-containing protein [Clostridia bacterium]